MRQEFGSAIDDLKKALGEDLRKLIKESTLSKADKAEAEKKIDGAAKAVGDLNLKGAYNAGFEFAKWLAQKNAAKEISEKQHTLTWLGLLLWAKAAIVIDKTTKQCSGKAVEWKPPDQIRLYFPNHGNGQEHAKLKSSDAASKAKAAAAVEAVNKKLAQCNEPDEKDAKTIADLFALPNF